MNLHNLLKNSILGVLMAAIMGIVGASFNFLAAHITVIRSEVTLICYLMPVIGLAIVFLYKKTGYDKIAGSDDIMRAIRDEKDIPLIGSFAAYFGMHLTNLSEGSAGREGGGFQIGAPIAIWIYKKLGIKIDRSCLIICALAATFAPLWGIPMFAAVFACEIEDGRIKPDCLIPALISAYGATHICRLIYPFTYAFPGFSVGSGNFASYVVMAAVIGLVCALISWVYVYALEFAGKLLSKLSGNPYVLIFIGGLICVGVCAAFGFDYVGGSGGLIQKCFAGNVGFEALALRLFTLAIAIKSGYKTGLLTQTFTMGALTGSLTGLVFGWPCDVCAMLGIIAMFMACYNTRLAALMLAAFAVHGSAAFEFESALIENIVSSWSWEKLAVVPVGEFISASATLLACMLIFLVAIVSAWLFSGNNKIYKAQNHSFKHPTKLK